MDGTEEHHVKQTWRFLSYVESKPKMKERRYECIMECLEGVQQLGRRGECDGVGKYDTCMKTE
jgi:hypothetical protein